MNNMRYDRLLEIFFRGLRGEDLRVKELADEFEVSTKSVTRSLNDLRAFLADHRDLVGNTEINYISQRKCYRLCMDEFLTNKELFSVVEVLIGSRAFSNIELLTLTDKLKRFTTSDDRAKLNELIGKELYNYSEVKHDCESVQDMLWQLINCISEKREISVDYYRMDRNFVTHRIRPLSVMFADYYFYLIAAPAADEKMNPKYFRIDRIKHITEHRKTFSGDDVPNFDEGLLRKRSLFMWPGPLRKIRFEFTGPSVQAVLDKIPTAKILDRAGGKYIIEAETYGDGIKMWLLSQGSWVRVISPSEFVDEMKCEIDKMKKMYE